MKQKIYQENPKQKFLKIFFQKIEKTCHNKNFVKIFRKKLRNFVEKTSTEKRF
jgi:hypothetical protein